MFLLLLYSCQSDQPCPECPPPPPPPPTTTTTTTTTDCSCYKDFSRFMVGNKMMCSFFFFVPASWISHVLNTWSLHARFKQCSTTPMGKKDSPAPVASVWLVFTIAQLCHAKVMVFRLKAGVGYISSPPITASVGGRIPDSSQLAAVVGDSNCRWPIQRIYCIPGPDCCTSCLWS